MQSTVGVANGVPHLGVEHLPVAIVHRRTYVQAASFFTAVHFPTKNTRTKLNKLRRVDHLVTR
jgi:hypothetical protein